MAAGDRSQAIEVLLDATDLPLTRPQILDLRTRAARLCVEVGERPRAIDLFRQVLEERTEDLELVREMASLCEHESRVLELASLRALLREYPDSTFGKEALQRLANESP